MTLYTQLYAPEVVLVNSVSTPIAICMYCVIYDGTLRACLDTFVILSVLDVCTTTCGRRRKYITLDICYRGICTCG